MKSLTPDKTIQRLGWTEARQSLKEALTRTAPMPKLPKLWGYQPRFLKLYARSLCAYCKAWVRWIPNTIKLWYGIWKNRKTHGDYAELAKTGMPAREIFKVTKRRMHLTEDEIFEQGNRILRGENLPEFKRPKELC